MNTTNTMRIAMLLVLAATLDVSPASAQSPSISVSNQQSRGTRRVEIVIQDPVQATETAPLETGEMSEPAQLLTPPDGGQIQGTMIAGGKRYAVTNTRMLAVGDSIAGHTVAQITLDHVVISRGARTYEMDLNNGSWTVASASTAE